MTRRVWLTLLLLSTGWSAAQTGVSGSGRSGPGQPGRGPGQMQTARGQMAQTQIAQAQMAQVQATQLQMTQAQAVPPGSGGSQATVDMTSASPTDDLISALRRSLGQEARGEAVLELVFPPSSTPIRRARALPRLDAVPALIRRNFVVTAAPDTVAGRPTTRYLLTPNNVQAARWTIWIDRQWKVPLAYQERMPDGTLARRAALLNVNAGLGRLFIVRTEQANTGQPKTVQTPVPGLKKALLSVLPGLSLPAGFEPIRVKRQADMAEVVLSDGLNVLALVVSSRAVQPASGVAVRRLGGPGLSGLGLGGPGLGGQSVWLVGNLPQNTLEAALSGIRRLDTAALTSMTGTFGSPAASEE